MKTKFVPLSEAYFPSLDYYQKAINYPYDAPTKPFSFVNGKCLEGVHLKTSDRVPILSVGSNRSPFQLRNKFSLNEELCVMPAVLYDCDVVYSASISHYGSIPATQWPSKGTRVKLNVLWLNKKQLEIMHLTEGIGIAYNFVELKKNSVSIEGIDYSGPVYGYVSVNGIYDFHEGSPKRLKCLRSMNATLEGFSELQSLFFLKKKINIRNMSLKDWIKKIILDKLYRFRLIEKMQMNCVLPKNPPWEIVRVHAKGTNIY